MTAGSSNRSFVRSRCAYLPHFRSSPSCRWDSYKDLGNGSRCIRQYYTRCRDWRLTGKANTSVRIQMQLIEIYDRHTVQQIRCAGLREGRLFRLYQSSAFKSRYGARFYALHFPIGLWTLPSSSISLGVDKHVPAPQAPSQINIMSAFWSQGSPTKRFLLRRIRDSRE